MANRKVGHRADLQGSQILHSSFVSSQKVFAVRALVGDGVQGVDAARDAGAWPKPESEKSIISYLENFLFEIKYTQQRKEVQSRSKLEVRVRNPYWFGFDSGNEDKSYSPEMKIQQCDIFSKLFLIGFRDGVTGGSEGSADPPYFSKI